MLKWLMLALNVVELSCQRNRVSKQLASPLDTAKCACSEKVLKDEPVSRRSGEYLLATC